MFKSITATVLSFLSVHAFAQPPPDFSQLPSDVTGRQAVLAEILSGSLDGYVPMRAEPISDEERAENVQKMRDIFKPIIEQSGDPEAVNRQLQQTIRRLRTQDTFHVKDGLEAFGWCRITFDANNIMHGLIYETSVYSCRLDHPDRQQATDVTEGLVQDINTIIAGMSGWTILDNESRRESARKSLPQRRQSLANAQRTANSEATVYLFKNLLEQAERDMNTEHFEMQQFSYYWTDDKSPTQPGLQTKAPYTLTIMINNTYYKSAEEIANVDEHAVSMAITIVKPHAAD